MKRGMSAAPLPLLGRIAVHLKLITEDQLAVATRKQAESGSAKNIGTILCELGFLTQAQLGQVLKARDQLVAKQRAMQAVASADREPEIGAAPVRAQTMARPAAPSAAAPPAPVQRTAQPAAAAPASAPAAAAPARSATSASADARGLLDLLRLGVERGASDIHIHAGTPLRFRLHGEFTAAGDEAIAPERAEQLVLSALTPEQSTLFRERGELDFAYEVPGLGRFRVNVYRQQRGCDGVFRAIPPSLRRSSSSACPQTLARFTNYHQGLVLVTGPASCGKSSTLAALVNLVNEERREHILTIEDPIEYLHPAKRCVVNQRNVGPHTETFARALRAALREDPDVIVIGELRDLETISLALTAAETGHLVLATLHTDSAIRTINRLVGVFPPEQQDQVRTMLSESLRAVVSQRLVPLTDGSGRTPALEVLVDQQGGRKPDPREQDVPDPLGRCRPAPRRACACSTTR